MGKGRGDTLLVSTLPCSCSLEPVSSFPAWDPARKALMWRESGTRHAGMWDDGLRSVPYSGLYVQGGNEKRGRKSPWISCSSSSESELEKHHPLRKKKREPWPLPLRGLRVGALTSKCDHACGFAQCRFPRGFDFLES